MEFPDPVIFVAIEPKTKADQDKLADSLDEAGRGGSDLPGALPTKRPGRPSSPAWASCTWRSSSTACCASSRWTPTSAGPQVAYRETITKARGEGEGRFVRQTGGRGQFGHVVIKMEPNDTAGLHFREQDRWRRHPQGVHRPRWRPACDEAMETGVLAGFPMEDVKVQLIDGSYHEVDSSEMAFKIAGSMAFKEAAKKAHPVLLEPIEDVEVVVPEEYMGDVIGDLNSRRGHIQGMELGPVPRSIRATVPLAQMFGYATDLRSATQGRAVYTMQFSHYAEVPTHHRARDHRPEGRQSSNE